MSSDSALLTAPSATTRKAGSVLFALSSEEWRLFFPGGVKPSSLEIMHYPQDATADSFSKTLMRFRPDVLVTSWSTPPLPPESFSGSSLTPGYICHTTGSVKHMIPRAFLERGGVVTNWGTLAAQNVAEHALLLILASLRRVPDWPAVISGQRPWHPSPVVTQTLYGKKVGIHGFGNVAQALVALLRPFGVSISAWSAGVPEDIYLRHGVTRCRGLEELMSESEIFVECEALTAQTRGTITGTLLRKLPEGALVVNVGRGPVLDEGVLAELAGEGRIRVALDVYNTDPIAPDSPLHNVEGAILSPHIAGPTSDQFARCGELVTRNLQAYFSGNPLEAVITLEVYDRST